MPVTRTFDRGTRIRTVLQRRLRGAAMTELLVVMLGLVPLTMGTIQGALIYNAKNVVNYATFEAARAGAVKNARRSAMKRELARHLTPLYGGGRDSRSLAKAYLKARLDTSLPAVPGTNVGSGTRLEIISPSREAFEDFGITVKGIRQIPNDHLRHRSRKVGARSGVNIQDANILKIKVTYGYKLTVPVINRIIGKTMALVDSGHANYYLADPPRLPIVATATVRMQSNAYLDDNLSNPPGGSGGAVDDGDSGDGDDTAGGDPGDVNTPAPGEDADEADPPCADGRCGQDGEEDEDEEKEEEQDPNPKEEEAPKCERQSEASDVPWYKRIFGAALEFGEGFIDGLGDQWRDFVDAITSPVEALKGLYEFGKAFLEDPEGTIDALADIFGEDIRKLLECGAYDKGRVLGQYISPNAIVKVGLKIAKFGGKISDYAAELKKGKKKNKDDDSVCASFVAGTEVWTEDQPVAIEDVTYGTMVLSRDATTFKDSPQKVTRTFGRVASSHYRIATELGNVLLTDEHPVWVQGMGWTPAREIEPGMVVGAVNGDLLITAVEHIPTAVRVYNFTVSRYESYFVGFGGIWVHNAAGCVRPTDKLTQKEFERLTEDPADPRKSGSPKAIEELRAVLAAQREGKIGKLKDRGVGDDFATTLYDVEVKAPRGLEFLNNTKKVKALSRRLQNPKFVLVLDARRLRPDDLYVIVNKLVELGAPRDSIIIPKGSSYGNIDVGGKIY